MTLGLKPSPKTKKLSAAQSSSFSHPDVHYAIDYFIALDIVIGLRGN